MEDDERNAALALSLCTSLERSTLRKLVRACGGPEQVWEADVQTWRGACQLRDDTVAQLDTWRRTFPVNRAQAQVLNRGMHCTVQGDANYPRRLLDLHDPPLVLFASRPIDSDWWGQSISIVGTRRASGYAIEAALWVSETLAAHGFNVVSGLALGVDGAAHQGALKADGMTTAVLASGVDVCYPPHHRKLYKEISAHGVVISENPPGVPVAKWRFPERNRIIAALSEQLIIVQAGDKSGALRTVDFALELGRDVYVVPGPITSIHFRGSNRLMQQGSEVLLDPLDLITRLSGPVTVTAASDKVPERWRELFDAIEGEVPSIVLAKTLGVPLSHVYAGLLELELAGHIHKRAGGMYAKARQR